MTNRRQIAINPRDRLYGHKALLLFPGLSGGARQVGGAILDHFNNKTGQCDPSLDRLAKLTGLNRRTVINAIEELTCPWVGLLSRCPHGGKFNRTAYQPNFVLFRKFVKDWDERMKNVDEAPVDAKTARKLIRDSINEQKGRSKSGSVPTSKQGKKLPCNQGKKLHFDDEEKCSQTNIINQSNLNLSKENVSAKSPPLPRQMDDQKERGRRANDSTDQFDAVLPISECKPRSLSTHAAAEGAKRRLFQKLREAETPLETYIDRITGSLWERAISAEMKQKGAGIFVIWAELKLE